MATVKHELTHVEQLQYPGGKNGLWRGRCTCGQYVTPNSATKKQAEEAHAAHAYARSQAVMTQQLFNLEDNTQAELTMATDKTCSSVELTLETTDKSMDSKFAHTQLTYEELWEHVHDCLEALERMGRK